MKRFVMLIVMILFGLCFFIYNAYATNSTIYCLDNSTLREIITIDAVNTSNISQVYNSSTYILDTFCSNNCDNSTPACNPPEYVANMYNLFWVVLIIIGGILIYNWGKKK